MEGEEKTIIHETAIIDKGAEIGKGCIIGPYCIVGKDVRLGRNCHLISSVIIDGPSQIGNGNVFHPFSIIGGPPQDLKYRGEKTLLIIGDGNIFRESVTVHRGTIQGNGRTVIGNSCLFMANSHIGHDCIVHDRVIMANCASLGGHVLVEENAILGGLVGVHQFTRIGAYTMIGAGAVVVSDIPPYTTSAGNHARLYGINIIGLRRNGFPSETISSLRDAYSLIFLSKKKRVDSLREARENFGKIKEVIRLIEFIETTKRGVARHGSE